MHIFTVWSTSVKHSVLIVLKVLVGAFNQEKALVGAFSVIVKSSSSTVQVRGVRGPVLHLPARAPHLLAVRGRARRHPRHAPRLRALLLQVLRQAAQTLARPPAAHHSVLR